MLERKGVVVLPFAEADAEASAEAVARWFPSQDDWRQAKGERLARALRVNCPLPAPQVPATVDWYLAAQSEGRGWLMVSEDQDREFQELTRKASLSTFRAALALLPQ